MTYLINPGWNGSNDLSLADPSRRFMPFHWSHLVSLKLCNFLRAYEMIPANGAGRTRIWRSQRLGQG
jgi:hypothetical protein